MHQCFPSPCYLVFKLLLSVLHHCCQMQRQQLAVRGGAEGSAHQLSPLHTQAESRQGVHITLPVTSRCPWRPAVPFYPLGSLCGTGCHPSAGHHYRVGPAVSTSVVALVNKKKCCVQPRKLLALFLGNLSEHCCLISLSDNSVQQCSSNLPVSWQGGDGSKPHCRAPGCGWEARCFLQPCCHMAAFPVTDGLV